MATVTGIVYGKLPNQPAETVEAFGLNEIVPDDFCTRYLAETVKDKDTIAKNKHDLTDKYFYLDVNKSVLDKKLPKFHTKNRTLTSRQRRKMQIHAIPKTDQKYSNYLKLHDLWEKYMREILRHDKPTFDINSKGTEEILLRADYHGCLMKVFQSKCPSYVGVTGIIMQDTKETFKIIDKQNKVRVIQKKSCIFLFKVGNFELKMFGKNFNYRPMDRINKKFKLRLSSGQL